MRGEMVHEDTSVSCCGVADNYRPLEGACCLHLRDLTSRLPGCEVEGITILRNIGNCVPFDTASLPDRLGSSAAPPQAPHISQNCALDQRGRQETGHIVLRVDSSRATNLQLRRTQVCCYVTDRNVKIEQEGRVLGHVVRSLVDYTLHIRDGCIIHSQRLRTSNLVRC